MFAPASTAVSQDRNTFVFFGWMALGVFGVVVKLLLNVHRLLGKEGDAPLTK